MACRATVQVELVAPFDLGIFPSSEAARILPWHSVEGFVVVVGAYGFGEGWGVGCRGASRVGVLSGDDGHEIRGWGMRGREDGLEVMSSIFWRRRVGKTLYLVGWVDFQGSGVGTKRIA